MDRQIRGQTDDQIYRNIDNNIYINYLGDGYDKQKYKIVKEHEQKQPYRFKQGQSKHTNNQVNKQTQYDTLPLPIKVKQHDMIIQTHIYKEKQINIQTTQNQ